MPTFNPAKPFGDKFTTDNDTQAGFLSLFAELAVCDSPPEGDDLIFELKEALTPSYLIGPDIAKKLPIYGKAKAFLERYGVEVPVTEESGTLVAKRLICCIWNEPEFDEDRREAFEAFDAFRQKKYSNSSTSIHQASTVPTTNISTNSGSNNRQICNDVAKRFNSEKSKFSGDSNECWPNFLESYQRMAIEIELSNVMKNKLLHHLLRDHALGFYRDYIEQKEPTFQEAVKLINEEFSSSVKMEATARKLQSLHISHYEKDDNTEEEALLDLAKDIQDLCPQDPVDCRTDRFRKNILYNSTTGRNWALNVTSSTNFLQLSYQKLLHELQNSLQQYNIHNKQDRNSDDDIPYRKSRVAETNFMGQGKYTKNHQKLSEHKRKVRLNRCWNCSKPDCTVKNCPYPKNPKKIRMNRIKHFEAKNGRLHSGVAETLFQFCEEYFEESDNSDDSSSENDEASGDTAAEIQHSLTEKIHNHRNKKEELGF